MSERDPNLKKWLDFLGIEEDCTCPYEYKSLGTLYGIGMGKGWVRLDTDSRCIEHSREAWKHKPG